MDMVPRQFRHRRLCVGAQPARPCPDRWRPPRLFAGAKPARPSGADPRRTHAARCGPRPLDQPPLAARRAEKGEHVWGGGEQMSYFDLRGRRFPLWTSRSPASAATRPAPITVQGRCAAARPAATTTPPTIRSRPFCRRARYAAASGDHRPTAPSISAMTRFHELEVWATPERFEFFAAADFPRPGGARLGPFRPAAAVAGLGL